MNATATNPVPDVVVKRDYDGYFEALVMKWIVTKSIANRQFKHTKVVISSGPYRSYAVDARSEGDTLNLDFYSALRTGFGSLSEEDIIAVIELL